MSVNHINRMVSNFMRSPETGNNRYGEEFLYFAIQRLKELKGSSTRYLFGQLMQAGFMGHNEYRETYLASRRKFADVKDSDSGDIMNDAIKRLKKEKGISERFIFSQLLQTGLVNHVDYRDSYPGLLDEFNRMKESKATQENK